MGDATVDREYYQSGGRHADHGARGTSHRDPDDQQKHANQQASDGSHRAQGEPGQGIAEPSWMQPAAGFRGTRVGDPQLSFHLLQKLAFAF